MNTPDKEVLNCVFFLLTRPYLIVSLFPVIWSNRRKFFETACKVFCRGPKNTSLPYFERDTDRQIEACSRICLDALSDTFCIRDYRHTDKDNPLFRIRLASREYPVSADIDWEGEFEDPEDHELLHRWNWLLVKLTEVKDHYLLQNWGKHYVYDWIRRYADKIDNSLRWNTYTTAERICNLIIFSDKVKLRHEETAKLALGVMAHRVLQHPEYYGEQYTFNHIINDARALFFYGHYFNSPNYRKNARLILENELPKLMTADGFLREGSSHYHFLFARWILEILYVAENYEDRSAISLVTPYAKKLIKKCWFFLVHDEKRSKWEIPLFGDVSPDFTPEWLATVPFSPLALNLYNPIGEAYTLECNGWASLFRNSGRSRVPHFEEYCDKEMKRIHAYSSSGWYRFDVNGTTLFLHIEPEGIPKHRGHFHNDTCAFYLYRQGRPVLIDTGRIHYVDDDMGRYGVSARSHNSVQIDGLDPYPDKRYSDVWGRVCGKPAVSWLEKGASLQIEVKNSGFGRIYNDNIRHVRKFRILSSRMIMEDYFLGANSHLVESFFHWAEGLQIKGANTSEELRITGHNQKYVVKYEGPGNTDVQIEFGNSQIPAGWYFPRYGEKIPVWTLIYKLETIFPTKQTYVIRWDQ
jgi:hypothetical protein